MTRQAERITKRLYLGLDVIGICLVLTIINWGGFNSDMTVGGALGYLLIQTNFDRWIKRPKARPTRAA